MSGHGRRRAGRELLSLIGKLAHACKVVRVGRIFLRRMIDQSMRAKRLDHWIYLSSELSTDVGWWQAFLQVWNYRCMMQLSSPRPPEVTFVSDASGSWGCGASWGEQFKTDGTATTEKSHMNLLSKLFQSLYQMKSPCCSFGCFKCSWGSPSSVLLCPVDNLFLLRVPVAITSGL